MTCEEGKHFVYKDNIGDCCPTNEPYCTYALQCNGNGIDFGYGNPVDW